MASTRMFASPLAAALLVATALNAAVCAQEVRQYRAEDSVDPREVARILGGGAPLERTPKMRSLRVLGPPAPSAGSAADTAAGATPRESASTPATALSLPVQFGFDSATILPEARNHLDALAAGIKLLANDQLVVIEGHTDAVGADGYNLQLSTRRAIAVKEYLVRVHSIESGRLATEGYGKFRPINGEDSRAAENRRVQIRGG